MSFWKKKKSNKYDFQDEDSEPIFWWIVAGLFMLGLIFYMTVNAQAQTITKVYAKDGLTNYRVRIDGAQPTQLLPCDIYYCGGGFVSQNWAVCNTWAAMSVANGRISCKVSYPTSWFPSNAAANKGIDYAMRAVAYMKLHAKEYGIDTNKIYLWGTSAGGFCALGVYQHKVRVAGICNAWGGVLQLSYLTQNNIPTINIGTVEDKIVPPNCGNAFGVSCCGQNAVYNEQLRLGIKTEQWMIDGYGHGMSPKDLEYNWRIKHCFDLTLQFFSSL